MNTFSKKLLLCTLAALPVYFSASAQTGTTSKKLIVASSSSDHPNERPQWSKAQAQAWFDKVGVIKGINHPIPPCNAISQDEALRLASSFGYNSVRWFLGGGNAQDYIASVENAAAAAWKYGMTLSPVFTFAHIPTSTADSLRLEGFVKQVVRRFRNDERIIMWDLWNEPPMFDNNTPEIMQTIRLMARWAREEGCTQAISASIIWDAGSGADGGQYKAQRNAAEAEMDIHNFHDYGMNEGHSSNVGIVVKRLKSISDRPIICTEALTRPNGSGVATSLRECAKYNIGFYTWGLYSSDPNWEVKWHRSTYYAFEPMFHNLVYAGGDPVDEREIEYVKQFKYTTETIYPGAEETEKWTPRRAWKWMCDEPLKIRYTNSVSEANSYLNQHSSNSAYNCIAVRLSYANYNSNGASSYYNTISSLANKASNAGLRVLPILLTSENLSTARSSLASYAYNIIDKFYNDRRFAGWCLFEQTSATEPANFKTVFQYLFSYVRYTFPNQPMFATPMLGSDVQADSTATDYVNYMWQLSDVTAFTTSGNAEISSSQLANIFTQYHRPLFFLNTNKLQDEFAPYHVNWATSSSNIKDDDIKSFKYTPLTTTVAGETYKMPSWKAWAQMNRGPIKGLYYKTPAAAIAGIKEQGPKGIYNSVSVQMNFDTYNRNNATYIQQFEELLATADQYGMTVVPMLVNDTYAKRNATSLQNYVSNMIKTYNNDPRILAWELYNRAGAGASLTSTLLNLIPQLFEAARSQSPNRPVFATPAVSTNKFAADFDYKFQLEHYAGGGGWDRLNFGNAGINLVYLCWQLSDIASINSSQNNPELGWLNSVAYKFGRPVICTRWETASSTTIDETLDIFSDHHQGWFADGAIDDSKVKDFKYQVIITDR